ncbi:MAG: hypothetical protein PVI03_03230 [Candidatus Thorarchaeota archaeon]|jgi:hypothetical protein
MSELPPQWEPDESEVKPIEVDPDKLPNRPTQAFSGMVRDPEQVSAEEREFQMYMREMTRPVRQGDVAKIIKHIEDNIIEPRIAKLENLMRELLEKLG